MLGIKDRDTFPLIFYRENCADMAVTEDDVAEDFLAQSKALLITGTHFSTEHVHRVSTTALERARRNGVRTVLDVDYRPVLWGLTKRGDGETRFIANDAVTAHLQAILPLFDLVIGTMEEFAIAGGSTDIIAALSAVRTVTPATLVVKRGPMGCAVIDGAIPRSLDDAFNGHGVEVEVLNVLGAGDAFSAGFLSGWVRGENYDECCRYANACGALVVSRHGCAPAMPTRVELDHYLANAESIPRPDRDVALTRLHRKTAPRAPRPELFIFAFDHRDQLLDLARATGASESRLPTLKKLFVEAVAQTEAARGLAGRIGLLCDDRYGQDALNAATGRGWWVGRPVEWPGSNPVVFEHGRSVGTTLIGWPVEQVVKCLVPFHPDDDVDNRLENEAQVKALYDAVQVSGHELLLEIVPPKHLPAGPGRAAACDEAAVQPGHLSGVVEAASAGGGRVAGDRRAGRRARSLVSRHRAARLERAYRRARPRFRRRGAQPQLPGFCRGTDDLPRACARVACRRDRRWRSGQGRAARISKR